MGRIFDQRCERLNYELLGILNGITADGVLNDAEIYALQDWLSLNEKLRTRQPFMEVMAHVEDVLEDGQIDAEERENLLHICEMHVDSELECMTDSDAHAQLVVQGAMKGVAFDNKINPGERAALQTLLEICAEFRNEWPFTALEEALHGDDARLLNKCRKFISRKIKKPVQYEEDVPFWGALQGPVLQTVSGICEESTEISFAGKRFCISGKLKAGPKKKFYDALYSIGAIGDDNFCQSTNYLVVSQQTNQLWKFSLYGDKIEKAMRWKEDGLEISIVSEDLFLKSLPEGLIK